MNEKKRQAKTISQQFTNELLKLAEKTEEDIRRIHDDYLEAMQSFTGIRPKFYIGLEAYENMIMVYILNLLKIRVKKRQKQLRKRMKELEKEKQNH